MINFVVLKYILTALYLAFCEVGMQVCMYAYNTCMKCNQNIVLYLIYHRYSGCFACSNILYL